MDWNDGPGTVAAVVAVLALVGSFLSFVRSLRAEKKAAAAEAHAVHAEEDANEARTRAAAALERANKIAEAQIPAPFVRWSDPVQISGSVNRNAVYRVQNIGNTVAVSATVIGVRGFVHPLEDGPRDVAPQQTLSFSAMGAGPGGVPAVRIDWAGPDGELDSTSTHV